MLTGGHDSQFDWRVETGGSIEGTGEPAFISRTLAQPPVPVLISVPHAGRAYPRSVIDSARSPTVLERRLEDRYVDVIAGKVSSALGTSLLVANAPRAMLDLNRSEDDIDWGMIADCPDAKGRSSQTTRRARSGLGLVPRRITGIGELWRQPLPHDRLLARIEQIHRPYHRKLGSELDRLRDIWGFAVLLDLHSMPPLTQHPSIDFVIGDQFGTSCAGALTSQVGLVLRQGGRTVSHNRPYSGCYVLDRHGRPRRDIHALQIEVCRSAYLDGMLDRPTPRTDKIAELILAALRSALSSFSDVGFAAE